MVLFHGTASSPYQALCNDHADGLEFQFGEQGAHPPISMANLFRDHLRLLGNNPANWTRKPIGEASHGLLPNGPQPPGQGASSSSSQWAIS